ncbi:MAG: ATP-binding protein [Gaiellaceae bacterium]
MPTELPTGTVTFLFTDVAGSTRLLEELGAEGYAEALRGHRAVIRDALAVHGGAEVDTQGDAFFCAFSSARAAVACAESVQSSLDRGPIRVRIGVHTGEALLAGAHYVGMDVHKAARIGASGHGGQVVISPATAGLLEPGAFALTDLGLHRLKDLSAPLTLYQLGDTDFGPLNTLFRTNLPVPATPFLGREAELRELVHRVSRESVRLLTLTGPGGTGKTRFALQLAAELSDAFPDGVSWVPLASLRDAGLVASAIAQTIDVEERAGEPLSAAIPRGLGAKRLLLLLDNCEHVVEAVSEVVSPLLAGCPNLLVLATSRQPLAVAGEQVYAVQPLEPTDALSLFETRARAAGAQFDPAESRAAMEALCARLDNLPLAVELAAARTAALPPAALLERLSSRIDVLRGPRDVDERQRTLHATISWSHDLLDGGEQRLFRRLAVFPAGAALDVVETVCEADLEELLSLVAQSLVRQTPASGGEPRYWMLETIREFAAAMLEEAGETSAYRDRHLDRFVAMARDSAARLAGPGSTEVLDRLEQDRENLRAAFSWAMARAEDGGENARGPYGGAAVSLSIVLSSLHVLRGRYAEGEDALRAALALGPVPLDAAILWSRLGRVLRQSGRPDGLDAHLEAARVLERVSERDEAWWGTWIDVKLEEAHHHYFQADVVELGRLIDQIEPEVRRHGNPRQELQFLHVTAQNAYRRERYALSDETESLIREIYRRSLELEDVQADFTLGFGLLWRGNLDEAESAFHRGLASARRRGDALIEVRCLVYALVLHRKRGDVEGVRALLEELRALDDLHGYVGLVQANAAWLASRDGDDDAAVAFAQAALAGWEAEDRLGPTVFQWTARFPLLGVELRRGRLEPALEHARAVLDASQQTLPSELHALVVDAVQTEDASVLAQAVECARTSGHA